jgi:polar amino acid transport system permease protein
VTVALAGGLEEPAAVPPIQRYHPVRTHLWLSIGALVAGLLIAAVTGLALWRFYDSLGVVGTALTVWAIGLFALGATVAVVLAACGCLAIARSIQAGRLTSDDRVAARAAGAAAKDWVWYVGGLGVSALVLAFLAFFLSANDGAVREQYLNWDAIKEFLPDLWKGFWLNIKVFVVAEILVLIWGLVLALARIFPGKAGRPVRFLAVTYIDLFRGFPAIITIYLVVLGFQAGDVPPFNQMQGDNKLFWLCTTALVLVYGAYVAEVYRSGLESIHWSQTAAARSLGLSYGQTMRYVITPQAVRRIIPPLLNDFIGLQKDTALLSVVGLLEVLNRARLTANQLFNLSPNLAAGVAFVLVTIPLARFTDWLVARQARQRAGG